MAASERSSRLPRLYYENLDLLRLGAKSAEGRLRTSTLRDIFSISRGSIGIRSKPQAGLVQHTCSQNQGVTEEDT